MNFSFIAFKGCIAWMLFGILYVPVFAALRKKLGRAAYAIIPSAVISSLPLLAFYEFDYAEYIYETKSILFNSTGIYTFAFAFILGGVGVLSAWFLSSWVEKQEYRALFHTISGLLLVTFILSDVNMALILIGLALALIITAEYIRLSKDRGRLAGFVKKVFNHALRESEAEGYTASFFYLISALVVTLILPQGIAAASIAILTFGDPAAVLVGKRAGGHKWLHNPDKSIEGSTAMFAVSVAVLLFFGFDLFVAFITAFYASLAESLPLKTSDNLIIPIVSGFTLFGLAVL